jgi:hypothetical protein
MLKDCSISEYVYGRFVDKSIGAQEYSNRKSGKIQGRISVNTVPVIPSYRDSIFIVSCRVMRNQAELGRNWPSPAEVGNVKIGKGNIL